MADVAAWKIGAVPVALRWDLPEWELTRVLEVLAPRAIFRGEPGDVVARAASAPLADDGVAPPHRFGVCSSGSTGTPKVILHTSPGLYTAAQRSTSAVVEAYRTLSTPQQLLVPNALYHSASITTAVLNLVSGNHTIVLERFDPEVLQDAVVRHRVTGFMAPTPMLLRLARSPAIARERFDSIEWVQHGASPLPEWLARFWIDLLGPERFFTSYGAAEAVGVVACRGDEWLTHPGTLGRGALGTDIAVLGEQGRVLAPGEIGQIFLRRPGGPSGTYVGTGVAPLDIHADGFATVGDLGWLDEDGFLYLSDRRVDLIVSGGANVYPAEVEAAVGEHREIDDVVVIGLPDDEWGKRVHAIVQLAPDSTLTEEDIRAFARSRLAPYKVPEDGRVRGAHATFGRDEDQPGVVDRGADRCAPGLTRLDAAGRHDPPPVHYGARAMDEGGHRSEEGEVGALVIDATTVDLRPGAVCGRRSLRRPALAAGERSGLVVTRHGLLGRHFLRARRKVQPRLRAVLEQ